jgi:flavin reductase (DIM6/NTAB) family NADH-FMN oxidoreductase RutF
MSSISDAPSTSPDIAQSMRDGLRHCAKSVSVISVEHHDQRYAMTATAVSEVSLEPPSMLVCINKAAEICLPLNDGANFCVNFLSSSQQEISNICGSKLSRGERFKVGDWQRTESGFLYLADAQVSFMCVYRQGVEFGSHVIFIGEVIGVHKCEPIDPLVYLDRNYVRIP